MNPYDKSLGLMGVSSKWAIYPQMGNTFGYQRKWNDPTRGYSENGRET